jgi:hypothetical protein
VLRLNFSGPRTSQEMERLKENSRHFMEESGQCKNGAGLEGESAKLELLQQDKRQRPS